MSKVLVSASKVAALSSVSSCGVGAQCIHPGLG